MPADTWCHNLILLVLGVPMVVLAYIYLPESKLPSAIEQNQDGLNDDNMIKVIGEPYSSAATLPPHPNQLVLDIYSLDTQIVLTRQQTSQIQHQLENMTCVITSVIPVYHGSFLDHKLDIPSRLLEYIKVSLTPRGSWQKTLQAAEEWCHDHNTSLRVHIFISAAGSLPYDEVEHIAHLVASFSKEFNHNQKRSHLVVETNIPQFAGVMSKEYSSMRVDVPRLTVAEFSHYAYLMYNGTSGYVAMSGTTIVRWGYKLGGDLDKLGGILFQGLNDTELLEVIDSKHEEQVGVLEGMTPDELSLLVRVAEAGPRGFLDKEKLSTLEKLRKVDFKDTVLYLTDHGRYAVWHTAHVYKLLGGDRKKIQKAGWGV